MSEENNQPENEPVEEQPSVAQAEEDIAVAEPANASEDAQAEGAKPAKSSKKKKKPIDLSPLVSNFAACGRCSYFLAGYRVLVGEEGLETAVANKKPNWLVLVWSHEMINLVTRSYGVRLDYENLSVNAICEECKRPFRLKHGDDEQTPQIEIHFSPK